MHSPFGVLSGQELASRTCRISPDKRRCGKLTRRPRLGAGPGRITSENATCHYESRTPTPHVRFLRCGQLTPKCKLEDFREFFDFKVGPWKNFHRRLKEYALLSATWAEIQESAAKREAVAVTFLEQVGSEYWGKENREKYLIEEHVQTGDVCVWPRDKKT